MRVFGKSLVLSFLLSATLAAQIPDVSFIDRLGPAATSATVFNFLVGFDEPVIGVNGADFAASTTAAGVTVAGLGNDALDFRFGGGRPTRAFAQNLAGPISTAFTVEFWIATDDSGGTLFDYCVNAANEDEISIKHNSGNVEFYVDDAVIASAAAIINDQAWHHIAARWTSATGSAQLFVDGAQVATGTGSIGHVIPAGGTVAVGSDVDTLAPAFSANLYGRYDDVRLWNTVRTNGQINGAMLRPQRPNQPEQILNWLCDVAEDLGLGSAGANDIRDTSPNGNHARFGSSQTPQFIAGPTMNGERYRVTLNLGASVPCVLTIGLEVLNDGSIVLAADGVTPLAAGMIGTETYSYAPATTALILPGTGEDLALFTLLTNGVNTNCATTGDSILIHFESPLGTFNGTLPVLVGQLYASGAHPGSSFPGLQVNIAASPAPSVIFDGNLMGGIFGPLTLPASGITLQGTVPPGVAGMSAIVQALAVTPTAANGFFATSVARELRFY